MTHFETDEGRPVTAVTTDEMREVDRVAVEAVGLELLQMMENAGRSLALTAAELTDGDPIVVFAGDGGNGGGGLCAARHLANHGHEVRVVVDRDPDELSGAAARQRRLLAATDASVDVDEPLDGATVAVDALIGYGLAGAARGRAAELVTRCNEAPRVLSLDVPSGIDATTGDRPGPAVDADRTLTLALPKTGLVDLDDVWLADIGVPEGVYDRVGIDYESPFGGRYRVPLRTGGSDVTSTLRG